MGWEKGRGIGNTFEGIVEPIKADTTFQNRRINNGDSYRSTNYKKMNELYKEKFGN